MKRFSKITAVVATAVAAITLAGCAGSCSGCGSKVVNNALTNSNWYTQTGYKGIQPYFVENNENFSAEKLVYDVNFESANNGYYKADYKDGKYSTEFYALEYDWSSEEIPENYRVESTEILYCYKTEFTVSVKFIKGEEETEWFEDSITTESYFRSAYYNLQPVYSSQHLKVTSPAKLNPATLDAAYTRYDVSYENYYNKACSEVTTLKTEGGKTTPTVNSKLNSASNSLFDNSSLYIAVRSMKLSGSLAQTIDLFNAQSGGISTINLTGSAAAIEKEELAKISSALAEKNLYTPVTEDAEGNTVEDNGVSTVAVSIAYNGGEMSGTSQTVWYAALNDNDSNTARCTMLKLLIPMPFGLGTLNFTLSEVESTLWNN